VITILAKRHRFVEIVIKGIPNFCKKFGIESGENISYRLCACQKEVIENRNKQILPYIRCRSAADAG
jgi:hypothetical protein